MKMFTKLLTTSCLVASLASSAQAIEFATDKIIPNAAKIQPNQVVDAYTNCVIKGYGYGLFSTLCTSGVIYSDEKGLQHELHYPSSKKDATSMTKDVIITRMRNEIDKFGPRVGRDKIAAKIRIDVKSGVAGIPSFMQKPNSQVPGLETTPMTISQPAVTVPGLRAAGTDLQ